MKTLIKVNIRIVNSVYKATSMQIEGWTYIRRNILSFFKELEEGMKKALDKDIKNRIEGAILEQIIFPESKDCIDTIYYTMHRKDVPKKIGSK